MPQSNLKYSSRQAGVTLFTPQAQSKPYDPYVIPIENITKSLDKARDAEIGNLRATGNAGITNLELEHRQIQNLEEHNAKVADINEKWDLEKFSAFSRGAQNLLGQYYDHQIAEGKRRGLTSYLELSVKAPNTAAALVEDWHKIFDSNGTVINQGILNGHLSLLKGDPLRLAQQWINSSGYERKTLLESMLADQLKLIPDRRAYLKQNWKAPWTKTKENPEGFTFNEMISDNPTGDETRDEFSTYLAAIDGFILDNHFTALGYSVETIATKVLPVLKKGADLDIQAAGNEQKLAEKGRYLKNRNRTLLDTLLTGGSGGEIARTISKDIYELHGQLNPEGIKGEWKDTLNDIVDLYKTDQISLVEVYAFLHDEFEVDGQGKQTVATWRSNELAETDFMNKIWLVTWADIKETERTYDNWIKVGKDALSEHYLLYGNKPVNEDVFNRIAELIHSKGGGRLKDIKQELRKSIDTEQGLEDDDALSDMLRQSSNGQSPVSASLFPGASPEAIEKGFEKGYLTAEDNVITPQRSKSLKADFSKIARDKLKAQNLWDQVGDQENISDNALDYYKTQYFDYLGKNPSLGAQGAHNFAIQQTHDYIEKNWENMKQTPDKNQENVQYRNTFRDELSNTQPGERVRLSPFKERIEYSIEYIQRARQRGDNRSLEKLIPAMWENENGEYVPFFDDAWEIAQMMTGRTRNGLLRDQLLAYGYDSETNQYKQAPVDQHYYQYRASRPIVDELHKDGRIDTGNYSWANVPKEFQEQPLSQISTMPLDVQMESFGFPITREFLTRAGFKSSQPFNEETHEILSQRYAKINGPNPPRWPSVYDGIKTGKVIKYSRIEDKRAGRQLGDTKLGPIGNTLVYSVISASDGMEYWGWKGQDGLLKDLWDFVTGGND